MASKAAATGAEPPRRPSRIQTGAPPLSPVLEPAHVETGLHVRKNARHRPDSRSRDGTIRAAPQVRKRKNGNDGERDLGEVRCS